MADEAMQVDNEIAASMGQQIGKLVSRIRFLKTMNAQVRIESGIDANEMEIDHYKGELLVLCNEYKAFTGENWSDEVGYARYVQPGQRVSYETETVDGLLIDLVKLHGDMSDVVDDPDEMQMRLEALDRLIKKLAACRKESSIKEQVRVQ